MQKQKPPRGIEWTRIPNPDGTIRPGYTWNVIGGCPHECKWVMPDGEVAQCYAKSVAQGVAAPFYPQGFEAHYFHEKRLKEPYGVKEGAGIFLDSMSDLLAARVPIEQINQVIQVCRENPHHIFQLLTKNPARLIGIDFPSNVWAGVSSPPDYMWGKRLTHDQQTRLLVRGLTMLKISNAALRWMSFEPLSQDWSSVVAQHPGVLQWAVIGAVSNGRKEFPPDEQHVRDLLDVLDEQAVPVFFKGNLRSLPWAARNWREDFPVVTPA